MATDYLLNMLNKDGVTLTYGGIPFFLPYDQAVPIPDWNFREVDHEKSMGEGGVAELVYMNIRVPGMRVAEELVDKQVPYANSKIGIVRIKGKRTGKQIWVHAGIAADTTARNAETCLIDGKTSCVQIHTEVSEVVPTEEERENALKLAKEYKGIVIQEYLNSKRERMAGGMGQKYPDPVTRSYMEELGIEDIDDVSAHAKQKGLDAQTIAAIVAGVLEAQRPHNATAIVEAVEAIRNRQTSGSFFKVQKRGGNKVDHDRVKAYDAAQKQQEEGELEEAEVVE